MTTTQVTVDVCYTSKGYFKSLLHTLLPFTRRLSLYFWEQLISLWAGNYPVSVPMKSGIWMTPSGRNTPSFWCSRRINIQTKRTIMCHQQGTGLQSFYPERHFYPFCSFWPTNTVSNFVFTCVIFPLVRPLITCLPWAKHLKMLWASAAKCSCCGCVSCRIWCKLDMCGIRGVSQ